MFTSQTEGTHADYILQDCHERQFEIMLQAFQEAQKLKKQLIEAGKRAIDKQLIKGKRQWQIQHRIYMNVLKNRHKIKILKARLCETSYEEIENRLLAFATDPQTAGQYQVFLLSSIVEGLVRMFEPKVYVRCLQRDAHIIQALLPQIRQIYRDFMVNNIGFEHPLEIEVAPDFVLTQRDPSDGPLTKSQEDSLSIGGVILADATGNITFKATLDSRLNILKEICLPLMREMMWDYRRESDR